ncbi:hypothetical protein GU926_07285 [Nibribacter ruber]|uniref:Lipoprotein n=1 Tax=Nibribacter ruber TaxID=2698458 RepID=A0A6P1NY08_9BACT|nr:hypothetical protein [Nibribacter ruber]QHL87244.1 hypothetical protein GU926_07285 [Nibribacter ruber]
MRYLQSLVLGLCVTVLVGCHEDRSGQEAIATTNQADQEMPIDSIFEPVREKAGTSNRPQEPEQEKVITSLEPQKPSVEVDVINGYLDDFRGCACYFARNQEELKQEKFIYFNDYQQKALVSINGSRISLVGAAKGNPSTLNSPYKDSKGHYEVTVTIQDSQQTGDEVASKKGTLMVKDLKTGASQSVPFVGECGC